MPRPCLRIAILLLLALILGSAAASAGPPFETDDPEPVPLSHWEFYAASIGTHDSGGTEATAPHVEINYGAAPGVQLHVLMPFMRTTAPGARGAYGYGDTEIGAKVRFLKETANRPEVGTFPLVELPTGDSSRGLGRGRTDWFIPIWVQKSWGSWTSYGGGGYWHNPGPGNQDWRFLGWEIQRSIPRFGFLGGEVFHTSASEVGSRGGSGFNVGGQLDFTDVHHLIFSVGRNITGPDNETWYIGYYVTL